MIQRLLRGQFFYVMLGLLILFLYGRMMSLGGWPIVSREPAKTPASTNEMANLWPETLNAATWQRLTHQEPHIVLLLSMLTIVMTGMAISGVVLTIWGLSTARVHRLWRFPSRELPSWSFGELGRVLLLTLMTASLAPFIRVAILSYKIGSDPDPHAWITTSMLLLDAFVILVVLTFAQGKGRSLWQAVGLSARHALRSIGVGLRSYVTVFPWIFLVLFLIVEMAQALHIEPPAEPIHELIFQEHRTSVFLLTVLLACAVGPLAEELLFRGILYPAIRRKTSRWIAMVVSGGVFAAIHTNLIGFLPIMLLGCLLAYLYERTGSLFSPLAVHMAHNTLLMSLAIVFRYIAALHPS